VLRVILIAFALTLLQVPYLKLVGAALLLWIGVKLLVPQEDAHSNIQGSDKLWAAVKTVIVADLVMSVDNVIAIAGAATSAGSTHQLPLVIFGLLVSIPIIVWGSQLVLKLMDRFPAIITIGGMLLGWIAGTMAHSDPAVTKAWLPQTQLWSYGFGYHRGCGCHCGWHCYQKSRVKGSLSDELSAYVLNFAKKRHDCVHYVILQASAGVC
jgi:YjbE family integral membrane protein